MIQTEPLARVQAHKSNSRLTVERARQLLSYDEATGSIVWKETTSNRVRVGSEAGSIATHGYREIGIDGVTYRAHRVAWLIHYGRWPDAFLDHRNGNVLDNRIENLREATPAQNAWNSRGHRDSQLGLKGVNWHKGRRKPFQARIYANGRMKSLGYFETAEEANRVYAKHAAQLFSEFARSS